MNIILAGHVATEAAHRLIQYEKPALSCRFSDRFLRLTDEMTGRSAINRDSIIQVISESGIEVGDDDILELSEFGIFGGLWEFEEIHGHGLNIDLNKISIRQEVIEICEHLNVNPYTYPSTGSFIIRSDRAYELKDYFEKNNIQAEVIGYETKDLGRVIINEDEIRFLTPPDRLLKDEQGVKNLRYEKGAYNERKDS